MAKRGRPSEYTQAVGDELCERLSKAESLRSICEDEHMPHRTTVMDWFNTESPRYNSEFSIQYAGARKSAGYYVGETTLEIANNMDGDVARDRLRYDAAKWYAGKLSPAVFGDKTVIEGGDPSSPVHVNHGPIPVAEAGRMIANVFGEIMRDKKEDSKTKQ